jgi:hypothetical protein
MTMMKRLTTNPVTNTAKLRKDTCMFSVATKTTLKNGDDLWETKKISQDQAMIILIHNGWTEKQAEFDLSQCANDLWIPVNNCTQIC